jgi:hypothetical protein
MHEHVDRATLPFGPRYHLGRGCEFAEVCCKSQRVRIVGRKQRADRFRLTAAGPIREGDPIAGPREGQSDPSSEAARCSRDER